MRCQRELIVTDNRFATTGANGTRVKALVWLNYTCVLESGHGELHTATTGGGGRIEWTALDPYFEREGLA